MKLGYEANDDDDILDSLLEETDEQGLSKSLEDQRKAGK